MSDYLKQLKEFRKHMESCFDVLMDSGTSEENDIFYNTPFTIMFHGKAVTLANGAEVFQAIEEIIQTEIDEEEI